MNLLAATYSTPSAALRGFAAACPWGDAPACLRASLPVQYSLLISDLSPDEHRHAVLIAAFEATLMADRDAWERVADGDSRPQPILLEVDATRSGYGECAQPLLRYGGGRSRVCLYHDHVWWVVTVEVSADDLDAANGWWDEWADRWLPLLRAGGYDSADAPTDRLTAAREAAQT